MKRLPYFIFLFLLATALCSSICGYNQTRATIDKDVNNALAMTLRQMPCDVVSADTIRCYRRFITIDEIRDTASIAMRSVRKNGRQDTELFAEAGCGVLTVFGLSDQRLSGTMMATALLWLIGSTAYGKRQRHALVPQEGITFGGITLHNNRFRTEGGEDIRFTPMQHELMGMFFRSEEHTLLKQDVCHHLWPKKPDASDTLYTLIRRLKPVLEEHSRLKIESDRGKTYILKDSKIG